MTPYNDLPETIARALMALDTAITEHERAGAPGYTLLLIPDAPERPVHVSVDGKPVDVDPYVAFDLALERRAKGP